MSYNEVFGGATLYPAGQTYLALTFSTDQTLSWPIEQQIAGNVVASIMDLNPTAAGLNVDIPDARQVSNGIQSVFNNIGGDTVTIRDATGGTIVSLGSGEAWVTYLADNSTEAGTWRIFQLGASVSVVNASALAGAGLKAISSTLNQRVAPTSTAVTPITWTDSNRAQLTIWTGGVGVLDFPSPGTVGSDWFAMVRNSGSGDLTLTPPSGTIDGSATLGMSPGESSIIVTDGTNFFTVGYGQSSTSVFDFIEINVAGSGDYTLSGVELNRISYRFTGVLTGNRNIIVPNSVQQYWVDNSTSGAFSLFIKTAAQVTPIEVLQGDRNILYCDGTDVVDAESSTVTFPIAVAQGGTGAATASAARVNLGVPADTLVLTAATGLTGGGDLTSPRSFDVGAGVGITVNADDVALDVASDLNVDHSGVSLLAGTGISGTGLGDLTASRTINALAATEGQVGVIEIATQGEVDTGTDDTRAVTPLKLASATSPVIFGAEKTVLETTNLDTTLTDDSDLTLALAAGTYLLEYYVQFYATTDGSMGFKLRLDWSGVLTRSGLMPGIQRINNVSSITGLLSGVDVTTTAGTISTSAVSRDFFWKTGSMVVGGSGTLAIQWAQNSSNANNLNVAASSFLKAIKVA